MALHILKTHHNTSKIHYIKALLLTHMNNLQTTGTTLALTSMSILFMRVEAQKKLNYLNDNLTTKTHNLSVLSFLLLPRSDVHLSIMLSRHQKDKKESKQRGREKIFSKVIFQTAQLLLFYLSFFCLMSWRILQNHRNV